MLIIIHHIRVFIKKKCLVILSVVLDKSFCLFVCFFYLMEGILIRIKTFSLLLLLLSWGKKTSACGVVFHLLVLSFAPFDRYGTMRYS